MIKYARDLLINLSSHQSLIQKPLKAKLATSKVYLKSELCYHYKQKFQNPHPVEIKLPQINSLTSKIGHCQAFSHTLQCLLFIKQKYFLQLNFNN